jgi:hypothetical protein
MGSIFKAITGGGGSSAPAKSAYQVKAEKRQSEDMDRLDKQEASRKDAFKRKRRGRASLISNDERGITSTLG